MASLGPVISPQELLDGCLQLLGHYQLAEDNTRMLISHLEKEGEIKTEAKDFPERVAQLLQMIVATKEYLYA